MTDHAESSLLPSIIDMDAYLIGKYPRKYDNARREWTRSENANIPPRHIDDLIAPLSLLLKMISVSMIEVAAMLMKRLLHNNTSVHNEIETKTDNKQVLDSIKACMTSIILKRGRTQKDLTEAKAVILTACMFNGDVNKVTIQEHLGVSMARMSKAVQKEDEVSYLHKKPKLYEMNQSTNHSRCISEFCHSDEPSVIDSNRCKIIEIDREKHVDRV